MYRPVGSIPCSSQTTSQNLEPTGFHAHLLFLLLLTGYLLLIAIAFKASLYSCIHATIQMKETHKLIIGGGWAIYSN